MHPAYKWGGSYSYPYHTNHNHMNYAPNDDPRAKEISSHMQMDPKTISSPYQPWPYGGNYCYNGPQECHGGYNHGYFGNSYGFRPPYLYYPPPPPPLYHSDGYYPPFPGAYPAYSFPPPHYSVEQPRYDYDKNENNHGFHRCCGCNHREDEKKSKIEPEVEKKTSDSLAPFLLKDYPYPIMWVPPSFMNNESKAKEKEKHSHDHVPLEPLEPLKKSGNGETDQDRQGVDGDDNRIPFPIFWFPSKNNEVGEKNVDLVTNKTSPFSRSEVESEMGSKPSVQKVIPVKQLETEEEKKSSKNIETKVKSGSVEKTDNGMEGKASPKTSKLPPVCLRIDPLPRKKNGSRSPSPPGDKTRSKGSPKDDLKSSEQQKIQLSEGLKKSKEEQSEGNIKTIKVVGKDSLADPCENVPKGAGNLVDPHKDVPKGAPKGAGSIADPCEDVPKGAANLVDPHKDVPRGAGNLVDPHKDVPKGAGSIVDACENVPKGASKGAGSIAGRCENVPKGAGSIADPNKDVPKGAGSIADPNKDVPKGVGSIADPCDNVPMGAGNGSEKGVISKAGKKKFSENEAALIIQSASRGFQVRKSKPIMKLRQISEVGKQVIELRNRIQELESSSSVICFDNKQKLVIGETIMSLLLKLDTIQGLHPVVREVRKKVAKELVGLQEKLDSLTSETPIQDVTKMVKDNDGIKENSETQLDDNNVRLVESAMNHEDDDNCADSRNTNLEPQIELQNEESNKELNNKQLQVEVETNQPLDSAESHNMNLGLETELLDEESYTGEGLNNNQLLVDDYDDVIQDKIVAESDTNDEVDDMMAKSAESDRNGEVDDMIAKSAESDRNGDVGDVKVDDMIEKSAESDRNGEVGDTEVDDKMPKSAESDRNGEVGDIEVDGMIPKSAECDRNGEAGDIKVDDMIPKSAESDTKGEVGDTELDGKRPKSAEVGDIKVDDMIEKSAEFGTNVETDDIEVDDMIPRSAESGTDIGKDVEEEKYRQSEEKAEQDSVNDVVVMDQLVKEQMGVIMELRARVKDLENKLLKNNSNKKTEKVKNKKKKKNKGRRSRGCVVEEELN